MRKILTNVILILSIILFSQNYLLAQYAEDFETADDVANWSNQDETNQWTVIAHTTNLGVSGSGALQLSDAGYGLLAKRAVTAEVGLSFTLSMDVKTVRWDDQANYPLTVELEGIDASGNVTYLNGSTDYTTVTLTGVTSATDGYIRIYGSNNLGQDTVWVDNISLTYIGTDAEITSFAVANQVGDTEIDSDNGTVMAYVMYDSTLSLDPTIEVSPHATITPTGAQDFSSTVTYTVTAEDGTTKDWDVTVTNVAAATGFEILAMANVDNIVDMRWDEYGHRIEADVMYDSTLTLSPTFDLSDFANISPASGSEQDFSGNLGVTYTVTAQDGNSLDWRVIIENIPASTEAEILTVYHDSAIVDQEWSDTNIVLYLATGIDSTNFAPEFTISEFATISPASGTTHDFFAGPVTYTVTAQDGVTTTEYVVSVKSEDITVPTITAAATTVGNFGDSIMVVGSEEGWAYLVLASDSTEVASTYIDSDTAYISVDNLEPDTMHVYMEDTWGNVSTFTTEDIVVTEDTLIVSSIAELWEMMDYDNVLFTDTSEAIVTFTQSFRNQKWMQDGTAGILIDDSDGVIPDTAAKATNYYAWGDGVTGLTGHLTVYKNVLEFVPTEIPTLSSTGNEIVPVEITLDELNSTDYQSQLVVIKNVTIDDADGSATFSTGHNYSIYNGETWGTLRTNFYDADYIGEVIPENGQNITGIAGQYYSSAQIYARALTDFDAVSDPILFVSDDINFGSVLFGETAYGEVHAMNIGGGDLTVSSAYIVGDNAFIFDDAPFVNQVVEDTYFGFTFAPAHVGDFAATFVIEYNDGEVAEVALTGSAASIPEVGYPYYEDFEAGMDDWINNEYDGAGFEWSYDADFDSYAATHVGYNNPGYPVSTDALLTSPIIDLTGAEFPVLNFENWMGNIGFANTEIWISTDAGDTWNSLGYYAPDASWTPEAASFDLGAYVGEQIMIGFYMYEPNYGYGSPVQWWVIDNIAVEEGPTTPIYTTNAEDFMFSATDLGSTSELDFNIWNSGISFFTVTSAAISGTDAADFTLTGGETLPWEVGMEGYGLYLNKNMLNYVVQFTPTTIGDKEAVLVVKYTDPRSGDYVDSIPLFGTGISCAEATAAVVGDNTAPYAPSWFDYTPATDELVTVSSCLAGQFVDTDVEIYDACDGNMVAANDDNADYCADGFEYSSTATFAAKAGVTYKIHWVDTWEASGFTFTVAAEPLNVAPTLLSIESQAIDAEVAHTTLTWEEAPQINPDTKSTVIGSVKDAKFKVDSRVFMSYDNYKNKSKCDDTLTPVGVDEGEPNDGPLSGAPAPVIVPGTEDDPYLITGIYNDPADPWDWWTIELTESAYLHASIEVTCGDIELWIINDAYSGYKSDNNYEGEGEEVHTGLYPAGTYYVLTRHSTGHGQESVDGGYKYNLAVWYTQPPTFGIYKDNLKIAWGPMAFEYTDETGQINVNSCYTVTQELYDGTESDHSNEMCITPVATEGTICDLAVEAFEGMNWSPGADYWFKFTPESAGIATMTSCLEENTDINPDTRFFIYEDCNIPEPGVEGGNEIAFSEDDGCEFTADGYTSTLSWTVNAGQTYIIMMDDYWDNRGFWFDISTAPIAEGEICESAIPLDLPVVAESGSTAGYGDDYDALSCNDTYITGEDKCYSIIVDQAGTISGDITGTYAGLYIIKGFPGDDECIAFAGGAESASFTDEPIDAGQYFVIVSSWSPTETTDFVFNLTHTPYSAVDVTFNVDMNVQIHLGNFDPAVDSVDVVTDATYWEYMGNMADADSNGIYSYTLSGVTVGEMLKYKYRINADWATAEFSDDIYSNREYVPVVGTNATDDLYDDAPIPTSAVTFNVNMSRYIALGYFDPDNSALDLAGSFNGWDGTGFEPVDDGGNFIYSITVDGLEVGTTIEFKFRMNGTWDGTEEFPNGGANRTYVVKSYDTDYDCWYNDIVISTDEVNAVPEFSVYPNPNKGLFNVTLNSETPKDYTIELMNVQGQVVYSNVISGATKYVNTIDVSELAKGVYYLKVNENFEKVIVE